MELINNNEKDFSIKFCCQLILIFYKYDQGLNISFSITKAKGLKRLISNQIVLQNQTNRQASGQKDRMTLVQQGSQSPRSLSNS
jgi:hypothetical protein